MPWRLSGMLRVIALLNLGIIAATFVALFFHPFIWVAVALIVVNAPLIFGFTSRSLRQSRQTFRNTERLFEQLKSLDEDERRLGTPAQGGQRTDGDQRESDPEVPRGDA